MPSRGAERYLRFSLLATAFLFSAGYATVGLVLLLLGVLAEGIRTRRVPWRRSPVDAALLAFGGIFIIAGLASPYRSVAVGSAVLSALTLYLGFGPMYQVLQNDHGFMKPLLWAWFAGGLVAAGWGIAVHNKLTGQGAFIAGSIDQNALGTTLLVALIMGMTVFLTTDSIRRLLVAFAVGIIASGLAVTYSRGAWIGAIMGLAMFVPLGGLRRLRTLLPLAALLVVVGVALAGADRAVLAERVLYTFKFSPPSSSRDRVALAESAIAIFRDYPILGTGLNTFSLVQPRYHLKDYPDLAPHAFAHNIFLNMAAEGGILGLGAFAAVVVAAVGAGWYAYRRSQTFEERIVSSGILSAFIGLMVHQQVDGTLITVHIGAGFWLLIAIMAALAAKRTEQTKTGAIQLQTVRERPSLLIVSNGHGEDAVGMAIADELSERARVTAFPLVGTGGAYHDVRLLDPRRPMPSGGFALRGSWRDVWADLWAGMAAHWRGQRATLRRERGRHRVVIAIGDVYCLQMAALARAPAVFIATAKSEYNEPHRWLERLLIRRRATLVFTRDEATADALRRAALPATYVGNPLMDTIVTIGAPLARDDGGPVVTILPGSRADAYQNLRPLLQLCETVAGRVQANFVCALAPGIELARTKSDAKETGWQANDDVLHRAGVAVRLTRAFGDAVRAADVVVGLAGTANEQAAGLGKPVVTFPGAGSQVTPQFVTLQKRLLGDALIAARDWSDAAGAVVRLLQDPAERTFRGEAGRQRMGEPGAVGRIAGSVLALLQEHDTPSPSPSPPARGEGGNEP